MTGTQNAASLVCQLRDASQNKLSAMPSAQSCPYRKPRIRLSHHGLFFGHRTISSSFCKSSRTLNHGINCASWARLRISRSKRSRRFLIGTGKLKELKQLADEVDAELVLVDHSLSPGQERNLERELERRVVDRTGLILDIFALRARTFEGKLQVELAQLDHLATRLVRGWTHLERQKGVSVYVAPAKPSLKRIVDCSISASGNCRRVCAV